MKHVCARQMINVIALLVISKRKADGIEKIDPELLSQRVDNLLENILKRERMQVSCKNNTGFKIKRFS